MSSHWENLLRALAAVLQINVLIRQGEAAVVLHYQNKPQSGQRSGFLLQQTETRMTWFIRMIMTGRSLYGGSLYAVLAFSRQDDLGVSQHNCGRERPGTPPPPPPLDSDMDTF